MQDWPGRRRGGLLWQSNAVTGFCVNYLAHFLLAAHSDRALVGAFLGDFVKGAVAGFDPDIALEIQIHRRIDAACDAHPVMIAARERFAPERRRFAGIALDVFHDHALARDWPQYSDLALARFAERAYRALDKHAAILPPNARLTAERMAAQDWLTAYAQFRGARRALAGIARRLSRGGERLEACVIDLERHYDALSAGFAPLFADLAQVASDARQYGHAPPR